MFPLSFVLEQIGGNGARAYQCAGCRGLITHSDRLIPIWGKNRHFHVNPAGVECDFHTFYACPGAVAVGEATTENSWFGGYGWRMAFCRYCGSHLGWHYEAVSVSMSPREFWGILASHLLGVE